MKDKASKIILIPLMLLLMVACLKPVTYPIEPIIEYVGFEPFSDTGKVVFSFTDGDGNIGLDQNLLTSPFNPGSFYYYNLYINYYEMMDGEWVRATSDPTGENSIFADTITFSYRIEYLTPTGQNKALRGNMEITLEPYFFNPSSNHNDTIKYTILLIDRDLNHSNVLSTPMILR